MGSLYRSRHELVFVFGKRGASGSTTCSSASTGRNRTNVWNYPGMNAFARRGRTRGLDLRPTVKPIAMVGERQIAREPPPSRRLAKSQSQKEARDFSKV
jgi:hypothetical protein